MMLGARSEPVKVTGPMPHVIPVGVRSVKVKSCGFKGMVKEDTLGMVKQDGQEGF
jgi:hypothetical protein